MPRFGQNRLIALLVGLTAGFVVATSSPAHAFHIELRPGDSGIAEVGEPLVLFGQVDNEDLDGSGNFSHTFNFGFDIGTLPEGVGGVTVTPAFLQVGSSIIAGFDDFEGTVTGPGITGSLNLDRDVAAQVPRINRIATPDFAVMDTGGTTPYVLTITGSLLPGVTVGNYSGDIGVTPLPGAALVLLSALGGLVAVRRYRRAPAVAA